MNQQAPVAWADIHEALVIAINQGAQRATVDLIEAVAESLGITELHGLSLREFYSLSAVARTETAISSIADTDQPLARSVKAQWDSLQSDKRESEKMETPARSRFSGFRGHSRTRGKS